MTGRLVLFSGLPGVGKSTLGRALAAATGGVHLEVDVAEAAIEASVLAPKSAEDAGYRVIAAQSASLLTLDAATLSTDAMVARIQSALA